MNETKKANEAGIELPVRYTISDPNRFAFATFYDGNGKRLGPEQITTALNDTPELTSLRSPWVRIESEVDLPKESGKSYYWTGKNGKVSQYAFFGLEKSLIRYILANEVAWMPVPDKPPPFDSNADAAGVEGE